MPPKKILVVEDDKLNMCLFHDLLGSQGYETVETADGREAFDLARQHRPDLILLDVQLPGVSGLELTRRFKSDRELNAVPIVAVTAFAGKRDEQRIRDSGCDAYVTKPFSVQGLLDVIDDKLDHGGDEEDEDDDLPIGVPPTPWTISEAFANAFAPIAPPPAADAARAETKDKGDGEPPVAMPPAPWSVSAAFADAIAPPARETPAEADSIAIPEPEAAAAPPVELPVAAAPEPTPAAPVEAKSNGIAAEIAVPAVAAAPEAAAQPGATPARGYDFWPYIAFVVVLLAAAAWPGGGRIEPAPDLYVVEFADDSSGLELGSPVRHLGAHVGRVARIDGDPVNAGRLGVWIDIDPGTTVTRDTTATLRRENVVGAAYIELSGGTRASPPLKDRRFQAVAKIPASTSQIDAALRDLPQVLARAMVLVDATARVLSDARSRALVDSLDNLRAFTAGMVETSGKIDFLASESMSATIAVRERAEQIDQLGRRLEQEIAAERSDPQRPITGEMQATVSELYRAASALNHAVAGLDAIVVDNRRALREIYARTAEDIPGLIAEVRGRLTQLVEIIKSSDAEPPPAPILNVEPAAGPDPR